MQFSISATPHVPTRFSHSSHRRAHAEALRDLMAVLDAAESGIHDTRPRQSELESAREHAIAQREYRERVATIAKLRNDTFARFELLALDANGRVSVVGGARLAA